MAYVGTVKLFGLIPINRDLYAVDEIQKKQWKKMLRPWVRWACKISWKSE
jgi:hypothetical protein